MFFDNLVEEHQLTEKQYSNIRTVANYIASYCLKHDIIDRNPIRDLEGIRYNFKKTAAYVEAIAKELQKGKTLNCTFSDFPMRKILEYWVRFLQENPDYLNPEVVIGLMDFETQTELVNAANNTIAKNTVPTT